MKNLLPLLVVSMFFLVQTKTVAQDVLFSQWENMPLHFNPALTGDFEGLVRFRGKHRNQWKSILGDDSYRTNAASVEYKFKKGEQRKINVGFHSIFDKAGETNFSAKTFNLSTSIVQNLGDVSGPHHTVGVGLKAGIGTRKIDADNLRWPTNTPFGLLFPPEDINSKVTFTDFSVGLFWNYITTTHFSFQLGSALHHVNRPDLSFSQTDLYELPLRFNLHGNVEIPICQQLSIVPSFLYTAQSPGDQILFGLSGKYYLQSSNANFLQLGLLGIATVNFDGTLSNVYVLSATVEVKNILLGFSYDRYEAPRNINGDRSNAYEFSVGYTIGR